MKTIIPILAALLVVTTNALGQLATKENRNAAVERTIRKLADDWSQANIKGDFATLEKIIAPEWVIVDPADGSLTTKDEEIRSLKTGDWKPSRLSMDEVTVAVYGDCAIYQSIFTKEATYQGKPDNGRYRLTEVFVKRDGAWRCVVTHMTAIPVKK